MAPALAAAVVERELRSHHFAVLATTGADGRPHAAGVTYGVSARGTDISLFIMTRRHLRKAVDIAVRPDVAFVVPLERRLLWPVPPATIQLSGRAELRDRTDAEGTAVFQRSWIGRRILDAYRRSFERGERRICFIRIAIDPVVRTYMVNSPLWRIASRMESGAVTVTLP